MALASTKVAQYLYHLRDTLRTNLGTHITAANAELGGTGVDQSATISTATGQIDLGNDPVLTARGAHYPQVLIDNVEIEYLPLRSAGAANARVLCALHVYAKTQGGTRHPTPSAMLSGLVTALAVQACIERDAPSSAYGNVLVTAVRDRTEDVTTEGVPHATHIRKYEVETEARFYVKQSRGST